MTSGPLAAASGPGGSTVLRPSRAAYARALRGNVWVALPLLVISLIRIGQNWWLLPFFAAVLLLTVGGVVLYFRNARIEYGGASCTVVSMFGARRIFRASDVTAVVTVTALTWTGLAGGVAQLIVLGADGAKILRLQGRTWKLDQFTGLANDLIARGVAHEAIGPIGAAALRERYPRVVHWYEVHRIATILLLSLALFVLVLAVVVVVIFSSPA